MTRRVTFPALAFTFALTVGGCGPSYHSVNGVVKLDGTPVPGATVTLVSDDGTTTYAGFTDDSGAFNVVGADSKGVLAGTYKVAVVKTPSVPGGENMTPGGTDYLKYMQKETPKAAAGAGTGPPPPPGMMMPGKKGAAGAKSSNELPEVYASVTSTPLTTKVPVEGGQLVLDLKKK